MREHIPPPGQKAPSAIRCIKTGSPPRGRSHPCRVRKHRAPKGALRRLLYGGLTISGTCQKAPSAIRCIKTARTVVLTIGLVSSVRKHRAPKGALRPRGADVHSASHLVGQKTPSAKRCIKTSRFSRSLVILLFLVRKHRAPKGALRRLVVLDLHIDDTGSESTKRQKVH